MNVYISYFYNIRFFSKNMIPVSTAIWDPKWYHNNGKNTDIFVDSNGVYNGVRCTELSPFKIGEHSCEKPCNQQPSNCTFITAYKNYIYSLDFNQVYGYFCELSSKLKKMRNLNVEPDVCLMVHEKPDNPCSERCVLVDWFKDNGIEVKEFEPGKINI